MNRKTYLYFPGCKINRHLPQYDASTRAVCSELDIVLDDTELNCCGYPMRHENFAASMTAAARNLAITDARGLALMTPCKCCYGNLKHADHWMRQDRRLRDQVNEELSKEGLAWKKDISIRHLLQIMDDDVGAQALQNRITRPLDGLRVAASYGCHALRPGNITHFDNPLSPTLFERLIKTTGATPIEWPQSTECCGRPLWEKNNRFSLALMDNKIEDARSEGADILATACTYCQMQFDSVQAERTGKGGSLLPTVLFTQLLGTAMGLSAECLGLPDNHIPWRPEDQR